MWSQESCVQAKSRAKCTKSQGSHIQSSVKNQGSCVPTKLSELREQNESRNEPKPIEQNEPRTKPIEQNEQREPKPREQNESRKPKLIEQNEPRNEPKPIEQNELRETKL
eukprot:10148754-Ditylum_brightwellii.AAC.1